MNLFACFDRTFIINLPERRDRRRDMEQQFKLLGLLQNEKIEFFRGIRPPSRDDWPSRGARGNFLSHYAVLREARDRKLQSVVVLEDDCNFTPSFAHLQGCFAETLGTLDWGIVHLGHIEPSSLETAGNLRLWKGAVQTSHFYAVHGRVLSRLVSYLEVVQSRPGGHPLGGPQYYDGALSMFRAQNEDVTTFLAIPSLGRQRSSRSDLNPRWFDEIPVTRNVAYALRRCREYWKRI